MTEHSVITCLNGANHVTDHALITCLSCPDDVPQEAIIKELCMHESRNQEAIIMDHSYDETCCSAGNNQKGEQAGIMHLSRPWSSDSACTAHVADHTLIT